MNIQEYISSGIVESYVFGLADENERAEFERLCAVYPELVAERNRVELLLEKYALVHSVRPPAVISSKILEQILDEDSGSPQERIAVIKQGSFFTAKKLWIMAAASIIVLLACGVLFYKLQTQNALLQQSNKQLAARAITSDSLLNSLVNRQKATDGNALYLTKLTGSNTITPVANIYWDSASQAVYMIVKNLAPLPANQQYQLWAVIDGKTHSLGVFDAASDRVILKMNNCKKATAFSITIEPKGGSTVPTTNSVQGSGENPGL